MTNVILFIALYIAIAVVTLFILCATWKYEEGDWEVDDTIDEVVPVSKERHREMIVAMSFFWPLVVVLVLALLPFKLMDKLAKRWIP